MSLMVKGKLPDEEYAKYDYFYDYEIIEVTTYRKFGTCTYVSEKRPTTDEEIKNELQKACERLGIKIPEYAELSHMMCAFDIFRSIGMRIG